MSNYELIRTEDDIEAASPQRAVENSFSELKDKASEREGAGPEEFERSRNKSTLFTVSGPPTLNLPDALISAIAESGIHAEYKDMTSHGGNKGGDYLVRPVKMEPNYSKSQPEFHPVLSQVSCNTVCVSSIDFN